MTGPRAIETHYGGCRFRSRLEARWAVFFDALDIEWRYEPEGYVLRDDMNYQRRYLCDFFLPRPGTWVEIKPASELLDLKLTACAVIDHGGLPHHGNPKLIVLGDIPRVRDDTPLHPGYDFHKGDIIEAHWRFFTPREPLRQVSAEQVVGSDAIYAFDDGYRPAINGRVVHHACPRELAHAYNAARSARFEHGEAA